jgi:hypothetical protein
VDCYQCPSRGILEGVLNARLGGVGSESPSTRALPGLAAVRSGKFGRLVTCVFAAATILLPIWAGIAASLRASFRDHLDVFNAMMLAPVGLLFPLAAVLLTCLGLYHELVARYVANTRTRIAATIYVGRHMLRIAAAALVVFFLYSFVPFLVSFYVWPAWGDPAVDPMGYEMTANQAVTNSFDRTTYSFLLQYGAIVFGLVYSAWVALAAAAYAVLGACFLLTIPNRIAALALPYIFYIAGTVAASLAGFPHLGLLYSVFPAGLEASDAVQAAAPTVVVIGSALVFSVIVILRARTNRRLA